MVFRRFSLALTWALIILVLSLLPSGNFPQVGFDGVDKLVHLFFYIVLTALMLYGFKSPHALLSFRKNSFTYTLTIGIIYGILIEILQDQLTNRYFEIGDILANATGSGIGCFLYSWLRKTSAD